MMERGPQPSFDRGPIRVRASDHEPEDLSPQAKAAAAEKIAENAEAETRSVRSTMIAVSYGQVRELRGVDRRVARYGDFSKMNNRWYASSSSKTNGRLANNPEEWAHYHTMYRQVRETWPVVPFKEEIRWLSERDGLVVGDFGCGEALIATEAGSRHTVHSFDHIAIDKRVIACDISHVPLEDESLDLAVFCLSLMGSNFTDYIREAHRCLRLDGMLHIWEAASYFEDVGKFCSALGRLGFEVASPRTEGAFVRIYTTKNAKKPDATLVLPFRGAAKVE
jgi:hypothetical protein